MLPPTTLHSVKFDVWIYMMYVNPEKHYQFNSAHVVCLSQTRTWNVNTICHRVCVYNGLRREVTVHFVNIGGIVDHHRFLHQFYVYTQSLVFICMFCRWLFVLLYFFFWPLFCLLFFDMQSLITPLVSSNSSYTFFSQYKFMYY